MTTGVRVEGLSKLVRSLERAGVEVTELKSIFGDIASDAATLAKGFAPMRTGRLRGSIRGNKAKNKAVVSAGSARVQYAKVINYGFPRRNIKAQRYMQRADDAIRPTLERRIEQGLQDLIDKNGLR